jgi:hypothetical protein
MAAGVEALDGDVEQRGRQRLRVDAARLRQLLAQGDAQEGEGVVALRHAARLAPRASGSADRMNEILPGLWHWTTFHAPIGARVSSYLVEPAGVVLDPKIPEEGLEAAFADRAAPQQIVLTSGLHDRDSREYAEHFGIPIRAPREAADRVGDTLQFTPYGDGEEVAPGVTALHTDVLCPDEYTLHVTGVGDGALAFADAITRHGDRLGFFSDSLLGDDPEKVKAGIRERLAAQLERDFDALLFAHSEPIVHGGKAVLRDFVT